MKNPALAYRQFSVQGATPLGLVVMLYDSAIAALQKAIIAIEAHDIQKKCNQMNRALAIIDQLEGTLNMELGGEAAQTLKALYLYARGQAMKANIENSAEILRALIAKLATVREAWYEADRRTSTSPPSPPTGGSPPEARHEAQPGEQPSPPRSARARSPYGSSLAGEPGSLRLSG